MSRRMLLSTSSRGGLITWKPTATQHEVVTTQVLPFPVEIVPIQSLEPDGVVPVESLWPGPVLPIALLAPAKPVLA